jgi:phosphoserine aminotransferase
MQYTAIVKNLIGLKPNRSCMLMRTGMWSIQTVDEISKHVPKDKVTIVTDCVTEHDCTAVSDPSTWKIDQKASFLCMCTNETVNGIEFPFTAFPFDKFPKDCAIVCDMSSNIGTCEIPWDKVAMVYAGA